MAILLPMRTHAYCSSGAQNISSVTCLSVNQNDGDLWPNMNHQAFRTSPTNVFTRGYCRAINVRIEGKKYILKCRNGAAFSVKVSSMEVGNL